MARVYMWSGNETEALTRAKAIIGKCHTPGSELFPFVAYPDATSATAPDRLFSSEILFGYYNSKRTDIFNNFFSTSLNSNNILTMHSQRIESMFDDDNDFRKKMWGIENINSEEVNYLKKYAEVNTSNETFDVKARYIMPALRISEMYLIAAECSNNNEESVKFINSLRNARNCISINFTNDAKKSIITNEYRREFLGEGQMFFYYKRLAFDNLPNGGDPQITFNMDLTKYVLPLPESEISQRN